MKKKILIRCVIGSVSGIAAMYIIPSIINRVPIYRIIYSDELLALAGSPTAATLLTVLVMGLFGALCVGGTCFYEIERWPLALSTAAHYLSMSLGYLIPNWLLRWNMPMKLLLTIEGFMTLGFSLIWLFMYLLYKRQVRELNKLIREREKREQ